MSCPASRTSGEAGAFFVAFIPGALIVVLTFALFQQAFDRQQATAAALCEGEAGRAAEQLERGLDARSFRLEQLATAVAAGGEAWRADALALTTGRMPFRAVVELETTLGVRAVFPAEARWLSSLDPRDDASRAGPLNSAGAATPREAVTVLSEALVSGERQVLVCAPIIRAARRTGWAVGVLRLNDLLDASLAPNLRRGYSVAVYAGTALLYGANAREGGSGVRFAQEAAVLRGPLLLRVRVWPAEELMGRHLLWFPQALLVMGMLLAFFVSLSLFLGRRHPTVAS